MNWLHRRYCSPEGAGSGGSADASGKGGGGDTDPGKSGDTKPRMISLEEAEGMVKSRLERERKKYSDYDAAKARLTELEEADKKRQITDAESAKDWEKSKDLLLKGHKDELTKLQTERDEARTRYRNLAVNQAVTGEVIKGGALKNAVEQVAQLLIPQVEIDAAGTPRFADGKTIADGVAAYLQANPHFVEPQHRKGGSGTNRTVSSNAHGSAGFTMEDLLGKSPEEIARIASENPGGIVAAANARSANPFRKVSKE